MNKYFKEKLDQLIGIGDDKTITIQIDKYPQYLYKYRDCNSPYNFDMIESQYLWADIPQHFYDPADSLVHLKLLSELPEIQKWLYNHLGELIYYNIPPKGMKKSKNGQTLEKYVDAQKHFLNESGKYDAEKARKIMLIETKKLPKKMQQEVRKAYNHMESEKFEEKIKEVITNVMTKVVNTLRDNVLICCLTERNDNHKMWEDYANQYSGFAVEYDLSKYDNSEDMTQTIARLFPVKYYKRFPKVSWLPFIEEEFYRVFYKKETNIDDNKRCLYNQLFVKKIEYKGEEEWRIVANKNKISFPIISAIYMGYKISANDEAQLTILCKKQNLSLHKQQKNPITGELCFKQILKEGVPV